MISRSQITKILSREIISTVLVFRWNLLLMSILTVYSWLSSFPLASPLPLTDITFNGIYLIAVIIGLIFVLRLNIPTLEIGWSVFGYAVLITFLNQFTVSPKLIGTILPDLFMSFGLIMIVLGLYFSLRRLEDELNKSKQAEADQLESELKYRNLFEQSRDAIYISTSEGRFIDVNNAALNLLGYSKEELLNLEIKQLYSNPGDRLEFIREMASKGYVRDYELDLVKKDGEKMTCLETAVARRVEHNRVTGYHGILRNITEQKEVQHELRVSEERFSSMIQSMNDLIFTASRKGAILTYYPPKECHDKRLPKEFINHKFEDVFPSQMVQNLYYAIESLEWGNTKYQFEYSVDSENSEKYWFNNIMTGQYSPDGRLKAVTIVQRNITSQRKADTELRTINAALTEAKIRAENMMRELEKTHDELQFAVDAAKEADRMKSEFLANTSHELRTPLNSIIGFLKLVLDDLCVSPDEVHEFLNHALQSSNLLLNLINDVLDIAKIEAGKMEILLEPVDVEKVFEEIYTLTHVQTEQKKLFLKISLSEDNLTVKADANKLRQILLNLVGNSIKFTSYGGIEIAAEKNSKTGQVKLSVIDTGVGIALEKQEKVFQKFTQADGSTSRKYGGTGLGLTITRSLVELMDGSITLFSAGPGTGTSMSFSLPLYTEASVKNHNKKEVVVT